MAKCYRHVVSATGVTIRPTSPASSTPDLLAVPRSRLANRLVGKLIKPPSGREAMLGDHMRKRAQYVLVILAALFLLWNLALIVVRLHDRRESISEPVSLAIVMILLMSSQALSLRR
jgi:hypothetical protein